MSSRDRFSLVMETLSINCYPGWEPALELSVFEMVMKGLCVNIKTSCEVRDFLKLMPAFCLLDMARAIFYLTPTQEALLRPPRLALERPGFHNLSPFARAAEGLGTYLLKEAF